MSKATNAGAELQQLRKKVDKPCEDCGVILEDVYENTIRCQKCRNKNKARNYYLRKKYQKGAKNERS
jgi:predicted RNA-binding Zn-ribbon protein involved in translation (DUF1610 family)